MSVIIDNLRRFNSKERFHLVGWALGNPEFELDSGFRDAVSKFFGIAVPQDAFVAMDFHLDWLFASLYYGSGMKIGSAAARDPLEISGSQQDIDLLVAWSDGGETPILLLEAKGVTDWGNKQLREKAARLRVIFGSDGSRWLADYRVRPRFGLVSPSTPQKVDTTQWPGWMKPGGDLPHIQLPLQGDFLRIERSDGQQSAAMGPYWVVKRR